MIKPTGYRVLVKDIIDNSDKIGNIFIPDAAKEMTGHAEVLNLGRGNVNKNGQVCDYPVDIGDIVIIPMNRECGTVIHHDEERLKIFDVEDLLAVIKPAEKKSKKK
jgi:co-chaperonin GroES (HSP10)